MIHITMCWLGKNWRDYINPSDFPVVSYGKPTLGTLIFLGVGRSPNDGQWTVETIGL